MARPDDPEMAAARPGIPRAVWLVTALHLMVLAGWSVLAPTFRAPDEYVHVDLARAVADTWSYPEYDELVVSAPIHRAIQSSPAYQAGAAPVDDVAAPSRSARPSFADLGPEGPTSQVNPLPQHPPLYYGLAAVVLEATDALPGGPLAFDRQVGVLRLLDVLLVAPLPVLAWATARRLGAGRPIATAAAVAVLAVPSLTHIGSVVNNDDLVILLGAVVVWLTARILTGDRGLATAVGAGLALGGALFTKGFAVPLVPFAVGAYAFAPGARRHLRTTVARAGTLLAVATAAGGWWWVRNLVVYGVAQPGVRLRDPSPVPIEPDVVDFVPTYLDRVVGSFWGSFGWREASLPIGTWLTATAVLVVGVAAALVVRPQTIPRSGVDRGGQATEIDARTPGWAVRGRIAWLLVPTVLLFAMVTSAGWGAYKKTGTPFASQGRYLFAGLVGLLVVAVLGLGRLAGRRRERWLPLAVLAAAVTVQGVAVAAVLDRYWVGDGPVDRVRALVAFAPWPPWVLAACAGLVVAALAATAAELAGLLPSRRRRPAPTITVGDPVAASTGGSTNRS